MAIVVHITTRAAWDTAIAAGRYAPPSLADEGFIHCSTPAQAVATANRYFRGRADLILLCIDAARVADTLRYEPPAPLAVARDPGMPGARSGAPDDRAGELFPHLHGPLRPDAVVEIVPFPCAPDGSFVLPAELGAASPRA